MSNHEFILSSEQIKMALNALNWNFKRLAKKADLHHNTVNNAIHRKVSKETLLKLRSVLEEEGLEVLEPGRQPGIGGSGLRWRDKDR